MTDISTMRYQPISLGSTCEAKFQLCRKLYSSYYGKMSEAGFRMHMLPPERGEKQYGWHAFDWQRTPFATLLTYLEQDFVGVMERPDLYLDGDFIYNRATGAEHSHQFPGFSGNWTDADVDRIHPHVQRNLQRRAQAFRDMSRAPGPYLYVWTASYYQDTDHLPPPDQVRRLLQLLSAGSPDHRFHLLMVANPGKDADYSEFGDTVSKAYRTEETGKAPTMAWEGHDAAWQAILEPFALTLHDREPAQAPARAVIQTLVSNPPESRGLFSRLLGR